MKTSSRNPRRAEAGYTLLIMLFIVASLIILLTAATPNLLTQGRREREEEMIWRGNQYVRAIGLYYRKFGKYPNKIDDLYQNTNGLRFLREEYKDPMNTVDGTWRLIYLGPNGQLIGSVNYTNMLQMAMPGGAAMGAPGTTPSGAVGTTQGSSPFGAPGAAPPAGTAAQPGAGQTPDQSASQESPLGGELIGGNLIGVGSKVKKSSIKNWNGASDYYHWEFIWKPIQVVGAPAAAQPPAAGTTGAPPANPGAAPPPGINEPGMPPETPAPPPDNPPSN
jgi:type II secretory pathway pseudopilin PulG